MQQPEKIRWAPRLRPELLERLYRSDSLGFQDEVLCDEVGLRLYTRCRTFALVIQNEVECPRCGSIYYVVQQGDNVCPEHDCGWTTTWSIYWESIANHYAQPGRAEAAFVKFYHQYLEANTYSTKILLIDELIHSFHMDEKLGTPTKSVASKLLEGNKKEVISFLDHLLARNSLEKNNWRQVVATTIDKCALARIIHDEAECRAY